ncbi:MAG: protease [Xanthomonadaceae bacterium]|nr:protease [Xanthomonadaceae bacterium]
MRQTSSHRSSRFFATAAIAGVTALTGAIAGLSGDVGAAPLLKRLYEADLAAPRANLAKTNPLRVGLYAVGDNRVEVVLTNTSRKTVRIPYWQLPSAMHESNVFRVSRNGEPVPFDGAMVKRRPPSASDFAILRPGRTYRTVVDLSVAYDMSAGGHYTVSFESPLQFASLTGSERLQQTNGAPMAAKSAPIQVRAVAAVTPANGRPRPPVFSSRRDNSNSAFGLNLTYVGCTTDRQDQLGNAVIAARNYAENAKGYLNSGTAGARYTSWFGAYTSTRYSTAQQHFVSIDTAMDQNNGALTLNCNCTAVPDPNNTYAYVFKSEHYQIYLCGAFWQAPLLGTDSKAGTLIHEMSHFNIVASTDDHIYGQTGARNLANTDPALAVDNADSHEYFAENTPFQN